MGSLKMKQPIAETLVDSFTTRCHYLYKKAPFKIQYILFGNIKNFQINQFGSNLY